jgi:outer membrane cobalamin receptor
MKKLFIIAISFLFSVSMMAQTTVTGNVKDAKSGDPLPGVNIKVVGKSLGTTTDFDGNYTLKTAHEVPFDIVVTTLGYASQTASVTKSNQTIDISLTENASDLDEVVVSASRTPESVRESPVTIERMDIRAIKNAAGPNFYSSIENLKGIDINTSSLTFNSVNARGFATYANTRFVQLIDGMDNASPALNFVMGNLVGINELDVNSVELLPGASSALYGANAFNGILFMTSKSPFEHQGISFYAKKGVTSSEALGTNPYHDFGIRAAHAFSDKFAAKASFSYLQGTDWAGTDMNEYEDVGGGYADIIHADEHSSTHNAINRYGDEVAVDINGVAQTLEGMGVLPAGASNLVPSTVVRRGKGYLETDLTDHEAKSMKFDASLNYRPNADDLEISLNYRVGLGNTIYQGTDRYQLKNFSMAQTKLEIKNDDFFLRGYMTTEDAGDSYDMNFAGINLAKYNASEWFGTYTGTYFQAVLLNGANDAQAHAAARANADAAYPMLEPGTPEFETELNRILDDPDVTTGAKFVDNTKLYVGEGNYNFKSLLNDAMDLQVGGSYREYLLNSGGTIFTDKDGTINYGEYGAYIQGIKKFIDDRLKLTASVRYDKSQNFDANLSPRVSVNYAAGANKKHNIRASYQTGFRNPTTQDQYIGLNAGPIILIGAAEDNLDKDLPGTDLVGRDAYTNAYTLISFKEFEASHNPADLKAVNGTGITNLVAPEKVSAIDVGYRGKLGVVSVDFNAYYNMYEGFISNTRVVTPNSGSVMDATGVIGLATDGGRAFQLYTNSDADVSSYGAIIGLNTRLADNYRVGLSYTYSKLDFDQTSNPDFRTYFNTPEHKVKFSLANPKLYKQLGFNVNVRWSDQYLWEATAASGLIDARTTVDAMLNYNVPKWKSVFKIGGANLGGKEYISSLGGGSVGSQYFVSWTINN